MKIKVILPSLVAVVLLAALMPGRKEFGYSYSKGGMWNYEKLVASFDFPILKTAEQLSSEKEKLGNTVVPYLNYSADRYSTMAQEAHAAFPENERFISYFVDDLYSYADKGILPDVDDSDYIPSSNGVVFVQKDKRALKVPVDELYSTKQVRSAILADLQREFGNLNVDSLLTSAHLYSLIVPNLSFDRQKTELVHKESSDYISPTSGIFHSGDVIISPGEIITPELVQILDSYKAESERNVGYTGPAYLRWAGSFLMALILVALLVGLIRLCRPVVLERQNEFLFILSMFCLAFVVARVSLLLPPSLIYIMPYPVFALYYMAFFRKKLACPLYVATLFPVLVIVQGGVLIFAMNLLSGMVGMFMFPRFDRGWRQFVTSLGVFAALVTVYFSYRLFNDTMSLFDLYDVLYMALGALVTILTYPLVYLFEIIFNLVSVSRLVELADTKAPLLKLLADKAPGTFQHSIAVMNMVENVGASIDADVPLLRAAALYHDVGKTANPLCFVENQTAAVNYHEGLSPRESASVITRHVSEGLALADKYRIPSVIKDFIASHHGTSSTAYFYNIYLNGGGNPDDKEGFFYPGPRPRTKEQVVLMLCDALEASSRTLNDFSPESVATLIHNIHLTKYKEGQYDDADITLHELKVLRESLKTYIVNMHHARIAYPERKKDE